MYQVPPVSAAALAAAAADDAAAAAAAAAQAEAAAAAAAVAAAAADSDASLTDSEDAGSSCDITYDYVMAAGRGSSGGGSVGSGQQGLAAAGSGSSGGGLGQLRVGGVLRRRMAGTSAGEDGSGVTVGAPAGGRESEPGGKHKQRPHLDKWRRWVVCRQRVNATKLTHL